MAGRPAVTVIGAGVAGTRCALHLRNEGFAVTLIALIALSDCGGPGEGASSGNPGGFGVASCPPLAMPGVLRKAPGSRSAMTIPASSGAASPGDSCPSSWRGRPRAWT